MLNELSNKLLKLKVLETLTDVLKNYTGEWEMFHVKHSRYYTLRIGCLMIPITKEQYYMFRDNLFNLEKEGL